MGIIITQIQQLLEEIRPALLQHGGNVSFVSYKNGIVSVKFAGACIGCPMSILTLKMGIEEHLASAIPEITEVILISE